MVGDSAIPKSRMVSPSAMRPAMAPQSGFMIAAQQRTATKVLTLKCLDAVIAMKIGRKANGVQEMNEKTSSVPEPWKARECGTHRLELAGKALPSLHLAPAW